MYCAPSNSENSDVTYVLVTNTQEKKLCFVEPRNVKKMSALTIGIGSIQTWHSSPDNRVRMDQR